MAFQFFTNSTVKTIASSSVREVMGTDMIRVSLTVGFLGNYLAFYVY